MAEERKIELAQLTKEADAALAAAVIKDCIAKGVPQDAQIVNRYTETAEGDLRVRTFMGDTLISESIIDKSLWKERKLN